MASKIFTSQNWRVICDTEEDQSTATTRQILAKSPSGTTSTFTATIDANVNRIYYDVKVIELTEVGDWRIWPKTTISGNIAPGDPAIQSILEEGTT